MNARLKETTVVAAPEDGITPPPSEGPKDAFSGFAGQAVEGLTEKPAIQEELVIEEVSIDGMCGVY